MGSIAKTGFSIANLLQTLTSAGSPQLSAALSLLPFRLRCKLRDPATWWISAIKPCNCRKRVSCWELQARPIRPRFPRRSIRCRLFWPPRVQLPRPVHPLHRLLISLVAIRAICSRKRCRRSSGLPQPSSLFDALG